MQRMHLYKRHRPVFNGLTLAVSSWTYISIALLTLQRRERQSDEYLYQEQFADQTDATAA